LHCIISINLKALKSFARTTLFPLVVSLNVEKLLSKFSNNETLILAYHGVNDNPNFNINGRHISTSQLDKHFKYLKENFNILPLRDVFEKTKTPQLNNKKSIVITFDDGYLNNYTKAVPLLEKYQIPATFYITSNCLTDSCFILWPDIIDIIKYSTKDCFIKIGETKFYFEGTSIPYSAEIKCNIYDYFKVMGAERESIFNELKKHYNLDAFLKSINDEDYKLVNVEQLKLFSNSAYVEIGSHTHKHYNLSNISTELAEEELRLSKKIIENVIGKNVISIAYPDGSYNEKVKELSLKIGYKYLLAVDYRCDNDKNDSNILPRLCISNTTTYHSNIIKINRSFRKVGF
jgi:peptidoglycan/xylan/chitin deacetylase (PgdA/CDA1 family)